MKKNEGYFINTFLVLGLLVLGLTITYRVVFYTESSDSDKSRKEKSDDLVFVIKDVSFVMKPVNGGSFRMGNSDTDVESGEYSNQSVTLDSYYIGETEVTQDLWRVVMGTTISQQRDKVNPLGPLRGVGGEYPMYYISRYECDEFIRKLNLLTGRSFRFPTEAEWEYAAKGGNKSNGYKYAGSNTLNSVAWYGDNSGNTTHIVKDKMPNELGVYDMTGNVWEWCRDDFKPNNYVLRGGSWYSEPSFCRLTKRHSLDYGCRETCYGIRLAMD